MTEGQLEEFASTRIFSSSYGFSSVSFSFMVAVNIYTTANLVLTPSSRLHHRNEDVLRIVVTNYTLNVIAITANYCCSHGGQG